MPHPSFPFTSAQIAALVALAHEAGARIMADWGRNPTVGRKPDGSPFTQTDIAAEAIITDGLRRHFQYAIVAEEAASAGAIPILAPGDPFWLVDALDGTREFIRDGKDFTVNIALIIDGEPVLGIIHAPAFGKTWTAMRGEGAYRLETPERKMEMRAHAVEKLSLLGGKTSSQPTVLDPFVGLHTVASREMRSSSLKFCLLAEGEADVYPRLGQTYEWDTAAGDAILREAGGIVLDLETRKPIVYGKTKIGFLNEGFIAGPRSLLKISAP